MKQFKKLMVAMMLLVVGLNVSTQVVQAESVADQEVSVSYIPPRSVSYTWRSPFDNGGPKYMRTVIDGYVYEGTLPFSHMEGWLFVYSGVLYRTPNVVPHTITE